MGLVEQVGVDALGDIGAAVPHSPADLVHGNAGVVGHAGKGVAKLVEAENEAILVEVENGTWYNPLMGYGLCHSPFRLREMLSWHEKAENTLN